MYWALVGVLGACGCIGCGYWVLVGFVGSTDPTVLPIRKVALALIYDRGPLRPLRGSAFGFGQPDRFATGAFLANHEIAIGVVNFALLVVSPDSLFTAQAFIACTY